MQLRGPIRRVCSALAVAVLGVASALPLAAAATRPAAAATSGWAPLGGEWSVREFSWATGGEGSNDVVLGPDGRMWTTFGASGALGALAADGGRTVYPASSSSSGPSSITVGPDAALWFTEQTAGRVGRMTVDGALVTVALAPGAQPSGITVGPDGAIWFTLFGTDRIGRIDPVSLELLEFDLPSFVQKPIGITAGVDGALWFTVEGGIGRIDTQGNSTVYDIDRSGAAPVAITTLSTGELAYVDFAADRLGRVSLAGAIVEAELPAGTGPADIGEGPTGLWVSSQGQEAMLRIRADGTVLDTVALTTDAAPDGLTFDRSGTLWVAEPEGARLAAVDPGPSPFETLELPTGTAVLRTQPTDDGGLWFSHDEGVGRVDPSGSVTLVPMPSADPQVIGITVGPDGNLWGVRGQASIVVRVTPDLVVTEFSVPGTNPEMAEITVGPDGALWFTLTNAGEVGRITTDGVVTTFPIGPGSTPVGIVTGADGRLWVALSDKDEIAAVTTDGTVTRYPLLGTGIQPQQVTLGPDGAVWYSGFNFGSVGRATTTGEVTAWNLQTFVFGIDAAADTGVWFGYFLAGSMGRFDPARGADLLTVPPGRLSDVSVGVTHVYAPLTLRSEAQILRLDLTTPLTPPLEPVVPVPPAPAPAPVVVTPAFTG
jgi:virginiamycin B lyase